MTEDGLKRGKPPYVIEKRSGYYWQPRGLICKVTVPCELGTDRVQAYLKGWELYFAAKEGLKQPSAAVKPYSVSWAASRWRKSSEFSFKSDGRPKSQKTLQYQEDWLKVIEAEIGQYDLRAFTKEHAKRVEGTASEGGPGRPRRRRS